MKILMITHLVPYPPRGGVAIRNFNLLKAVARHHEVHLLTFNQRVHFASAEELARSTEALRGYCTHLEVFDIPTDKSKLAWYLLLFLNLFSLTPYSVWRFSSREIVEAIKTQSKSYLFDLVEIGTIALARLARFAPELPSILVHHNIESELLQRRSALAPNLLSKLYLKYQAWKLRKLEARAGTCFACHTVCSEKDKATLSRINPDARVLVVPNGVDVDYFRPTDEPVVPGSLVFVGGLGWFPNRDGMLYFKNKIWPLLKERAPDVRIDIIGGDPPRELVDFSRHDENFRVLGFVEDIRPHVARAAVYVVPLRVGGGTRLKILDAMAMGKAVVSTTVGCEGIELEHEKEILIADEPGEFAAQVCRLLGDHQRRTEMGARVRAKAVDVYSWTKIARRLDQAYGEARGGRMRSASVYPGATLPGGTPDSDRNDRGTDAGMPPHRQDRR